jgi:hypothetical protein
MRKYWRVNIAPRFHDSTMGIYDGGTPTMNVVHKFISSLFYREWGYDRLHRLTYLLFREVISIIA